MSVPKHSNFEMKRLMWSKNAVIPILIKILVTLFWLVVTAQVKDWINWVSVAGFWTECENIELFNTGHMQWLYNTQWAIWSSSNILTLKMTQGQMEDRKEVFLIVASM